MAAAVAMRRKPERRCIKPFDAIDSQCGTAFAVRIGFLIYRLDSPNEHIISTPNKIMNGRPDQIKSAYEYDRTEI
jgi:hypothetical protein